MISDSTNLVYGTTNEWMNGRWEWIILSVRSLTDFEENIVVTVLAKLVLFVFKCSYAFGNKIRVPGMTIGASGAAALNEINDRSAR